MHSAQQHGSSFRVFGAANPARGLVSLLLKNATNRGPPLRSGGSIYLPEIWIYLRPKQPSLTGPLAIQVNEASKLVKRHKQRCATSREGARTPHGPALSPVISSQGRSPRARPGGPPPPRRPITATPPLRLVFDRKADTEATHLRLQHGAAYFRPRAASPRPEPSAKAEGTQPRRALELPPRASSTGQGPGPRQ